MNTTCIVGRKMYDKQKKNLLEFLKKFIRNISITKKRLKLLNKIKGKDL